MRGRMNCNYNRVKKGTIVEILEEIWNEASEEKRGYRFKTRSGAIHRCYRHRIDIIKEKPYSMRKVVVKAEKRDEVLL